MTSTVLGTSNTLFQEEAQETCSKIWVIINTPGLLLVETFFIWFSPLCCVCWFFTEYKWGEKNKTNKKLQQNKQTKSPTTKSTDKQKTPPPPTKNPNQTLTHQPKNPSPPPKTPLCNVPSISPQFFFWQDQVVFWCCIFLVCRRFGIDLQPHKEIQHLDSGLQ